MKVLFLDIDGVLNNGPTFDRMQANFDAASSAPYFNSNPSSLRWQLFDPKCVKQINRVCQEPGAKVMMSSSWAVSSDYTWEELLIWLKQQGLEVDIIDRTPRKLESLRINEIHWSLEEYPEITSFAVVDDNCLNGFGNGDLAPFMVQTKFDLGCTKKDADKLIEILNREP